MRVLVNIKAVLAAAVAATIGLAVPARAQEGAEVQRIEVNQVHYNFEGTAIHVTGELAYFERFTTDATGGSHGVIHLNATGLKGVDEFGTTYRGTWTQSNAFSGPAGEGQSVTETLTFLLTGPGQGNDMRVSLNAHITVSATGEVVVSFTHMTVD